MAEGATPTNDGHATDAHGREGHMLVMDLRRSSSMKSLGKAIQAYDEEHDGAASSTKPISKANADCMTLTDMDDPLESAPFPKQNQPPKILALLNDMRDHSLSSDEGPEHNLRVSKYGHDNKTQTGEPSTNRSIGVVQDGITLLCAAEFAKGTTAVSSSMKSDSRVDPKIEENVISLGRPSALMLNPVKAVQDAPGSEEHMLVVGRPSSSWTKSRGKAIEAYDQKHDGAPSSTKIIPKANAAVACLVQMQLDAGPSVRGPAQHHDGVVAAIGGPAQANATDVAANVVRAIPAVAQHDVNVAIAAIGGGVARQVPAPAPMNGGAIAVIAAGPAPAAIPVPVLSPIPGANNIDPLAKSSIRALRNPADGDEGKLWDKLTY